VAYLYEHKKISDDSNVWFSARVCRSFSVEANLSETETTFFLLRSETEGFVLLVSLYSKTANLRTNEKETKGKKQSKAK
jgi:hypothetical protein